MIINYSPYPPKRYKETTPIYTKLLRDSTLDEATRWRLALLDVENYGYVGPEKGWEVGL